MWNIIVGILLILAGLSGRFVMLGTRSPVPLIVIGALMVVWGVFQVFRKRL